MKITKIEIYLVANPWKAWLFTRVLTDDGLYGVGEGTLGQLNRSVAGAIRDMESFVIGADPFNIEALVHRMSRDVYGDGGQIKMCAIAAIEMACWDIVGKALDQPVYNLLGGRCHESLRAYANGWYRCERTPEAFAELAGRVAELGYTAMKFDPFGVGWRVLTPREEDLSVDIVRAVRDKVGGQIDLMIEAHSRFGVASAIRMGNRLEEFRPAWFEEPVPHHDIAATIEVARAIPVPVATGESLSSKQAFAELLKHNVIEIVQIEPMYVGGILASKKIADMADAHYGVIAPHAASGPISTAACVHLDACTPNTYVQEYFHDFNVAWEHDVVTGTPLCRNGYIDIPTAPGLGVDLNLEEIKKHSDVQRLDNNLFAENWHLRSGAEPVDTGDDNRKAESL